jgi:hypothetical protein
MQLVLRRSTQGPFLTQVIAYGLDQKRLTPEHLEQIKSKAILMSLKFADKFYNKYKMDLLEQAAQDIIGVVSLGLAELSKQDIDTALSVLTAPESIVKPFQKGWSMLSQVSLISATQKSLYGDVDAHLLANISSAPYEDQWLGLRHYEQALQRWQQEQAMNTLKATFFYANQQDETEYFGLESMLAEALIYRICCAGAKVKPDLKHKLKNIELQDAWLDEAFLQTELQNTLRLLPAELAAAIRADLGPHFIQQIINTLRFARRYQTLLAENASPEKRDTFEYKQSMLHPLLGWPQYIEF